MFNTESTPVSLPTIHQPLHSKVSNYLNNQRRSGQYCDLIIELELSEEECDGYETSVGESAIARMHQGALYGHFCVIGAQSEFVSGSDFQQKSVSFSTHNPMKLSIKNFACHSCLRTMVDFFYEDVVSIAKDHEPHFRRLAKILAVRELMNLFEGQQEDPLPAGMDADAPTTTSQIECTSFEEQRMYFKLSNPRAINGATICGNKVNYCIGCEFKCYRVHDMLNHMSSCEASHLTCSLCDVGFLGWREYEAHIRRHSADVKKPFFCLECGVRFMTRAALQVHHPKHSAETPHLCPHCGKGFKWKQGLSSHLLIHSKERPMLCDVCGYSATHMKALKSHKLRHTGELFKCPWAGCTHRANRKENLKLHIETHKQERPFVCEVCGCKFSQSKNLKRHALRHAGEEGLKHGCALCAFSSHRSDKLREHIQRVHTEKAVQLELSETVENSFESKSNDDEFRLPSLPDQMTAQPAQTPDKAKKRAEATRLSSRMKLHAKVLTGGRRTRPLAPKPAPT